MRLSHYARWDGTQTPIGEDITVEDLLEAMSEDLLGGEGIERALNRIMRRGVPGRFGGMQSLLDRLRRARRAERERGRLDGVLEQIRERLDGVLDKERAVLAAQEDDEARMRESYLDSLPESTPGCIEGLKEYDFASPEAGAEFRALLEMLRREFLSGAVGRLSESMRNLSAEQRQRLKDMLGDLNRMIDQRRAGTGPSQEQFDEFMRRHGDFFPENPRTFDQLMEALARRAMAMSRFLASLSPEQRDELMELSRQIMEDLDLQFEVDRLGGAMRELFPDLGWDEPAPIDGEEPLGLQQALEAIERMSDSEQLERALKGDYAGASLDDVDADRLRRTLGEDAVRDLERLKRVEKALQDAGILTRRGGRLELTPRGVRKIGDRALARVFQRITLDRPGAHDVPESGGLGEPTGSTRPWRFGDAYRIDVQRTVHNAVLREGPTRGRIRLRPDDFEVVEAENRTGVATVLLLDMSFSMPMRGNWIPAKRMALALHSLIASKYPEDHLSIVGFSDLARVMTPEDLASSGWEHVYGTNMQHAFNLAGRLLAKHPAATKQVLLVTDGEPTAHLVPGDPPVRFHWPPVRETIEKTYKEAMRLGKQGVTMNVFMLEDSPALFRFIDRLARVVQGRVFWVRGDDLGEFVVRDYLSRRSG